MAFCSVSCLLFSVSWKDAHAWIQRPPWCRVISPQHPYLITSAKTLSPNTITLWGSGGRACNSQSEKESKKYSLSETTEASDTTTTVPSLLWAASKGCISFTWWHWGGGILTPLGSEMSRPRLVCPQKTWLTLSLSMGALKRVKEMMPEEAADGAWGGWPVSCVLSAAEPEDCWFLDSPWIKSTETSALFLPGATRWG